MRESGLIVFQVICFQRSSLLSEFIKLFEWIHQVVLSGSSSSFMGKFKSFGGRYGICNLFWEQLLNEIEQTSTCDLFVQVDFFCEYCTPKTYKTYFDVYIVLLK